MSTVNARDPRTALVEEKYFSLRPKPLERWLWQQALPPAAERVFWLHWEEGMRRGDWCSELSLKQVARECCVDTSTVTRAYQLLKGRELIRREDPGRDPGNPFQQAIAITEVRIPRELLQQLGRAPNRAKKRVEQGAVQTISAPASAMSAAPAGATRAPVPMLCRAASAALLQRLSVNERAAFFTASRDRQRVMGFDSGTALNPGEQAQIQALLAQLCSDSAPVRATAPASPRVFSPHAALRRLSPLEAARLRKSVVMVAGTDAGTDVFRQVLWSVEEGALRRFDTRLATNIALKKIREGAWSRPNRMPPNWLRTAAPETCNAA